MEPANLLHLMLTPAKILTGFIMMRIITLLAALAAHLTATSQQRDWFEMLDDPTANFYDIQQAADAHFDSASTGKGTGWKAWKRWEYHAQLLIDAQGHFPDPAVRLAGIEEHIRNTFDRSYSTTTGNWTELGPTYVPSNGTGQPTGIGRLTAIAFDPSTSSTVYAGAASGGIWKSTNNGNTWTSITSNLPSLGVSAIVVHPTNSAIMWVGTGDRDAGDAPGYGVYYTTNGGVTWVARNSGMTDRTVYEILMHPTNSNILIASTNSRIYRTTDGGVTWTQVYSAGENFKDIAFKPGDPNYVYAGSNSNFFRSTDNGLTWTEITSGVPTTATRFALAVSANQPSYVYIFAANANGFVGLYRSTNSGTSFSTQSTTPNICDWSTNGSGTGSQAWYDLVLLADPGNADVLYAGSINIWKSTNGGVTWTLSAHWTGSGGADAIHADQHVLEWHTPSGDIYVGCDGGLYITPDDGVNYNDFSDDLAIAQAYKIGQSALTKNLVINGYQDNGTGILRPGGWFTEIGGDGMECIVDPTDNNYMYGALYYGDIRRSTDGGYTFGGNIGPTGGNGGWVTPYKLDPNNASRMLVGREQVWRTANVKTGTPVWTSISTFTGTSTIVDIAIAPSNSDVVYVSRNGSSNLYRSDNATGAAPTWTDLDANLPAAGVPLDIEVDPTNPATVWIAYNNSVYKSTNSGVSWTNISSGLPAGLAVYCLGRDKNGPAGALYAGIAAGVYYIDNSMSGWVSFSTGIPIVEVTELEFFYDAGCGGDTKVRAATYGRGLWESDLRASSSLAPIACFTTTTTSVCQGATVTFTDQSSHLPTAWSWTFSPSTITYTGGTSSSSQNPKVIFTASGTYTVTMTATNANGSDSEVKSAYISVMAAVTLPATENFEGTALCGTASNCASTSCVITSNSWSNVANGVDDGIDWRTNEGPTPSANTGPDVDFNPGSATGNYVYLEASACYNQEAILLSDCIDLTNASDADLTFAYHRYGAAMGPLYVDVLENGTWTNGIWSITGNQGNSWQTATVSLLSYAGDVIQLRFRGVTGNDFSSDMALDYIQVTYDQLLPLDHITLSGEHVLQVGNVLTWDVAAGNALLWSVVERLNASGYFEHVSAPIPVERGAPTFTDRSYSEPVSYYRLRFLTASGEAKYSNTIQVTAPTDHALTAQPNPFTDVLSLTLTGGATGNIVMLDVHGREVRRASLVDRHDVSIPTGDLLPGVYFIRFHDEVIKVVK